MPKNFAESFGAKIFLVVALIDCHPEPSKTVLKKMLKQPIQNMYTTEEEGVKKMILQKPWMCGDEFVGVVEISFLLDSDIPNHVRE